MIHTTHRTAPQGTHTLLSCAIFFCICHLQRFRRTRARAFHPHTALHHATYCTRIRITIRTHARTRTRTRTQDDTTPHRLTTLHERIHERTNEQTDQVASLKWEREWDGDWFVLFVIIHRSNDRTHAWILGEDGSPVRLSCRLLTGSLHSRPPLPTLSSLFFRLRPPAPPLAPFQKPYLAFQAFLPCPYFTFKKRFLFTCNEIRSRIPLPPYPLQPTALHLLGRISFLTVLTALSLTLNQPHSDVFLARLLREGAATRLRRAPNRLASRSPLHRGSQPPDPSTCLGPLSRPYARSGRNVRNVTFASVASPKLKERRN